MVVNTEGFNCNITSPNPACSGQPFCFAQPSTTPPSQGVLVTNINVYNSSGTFTSIPTGCLNNGLAAGQYTLSVLNVLYANLFLTDTICKCKTQTAITVYANPSTPTVYVSPTSVCNGQPVTLSAISNSATTYSWQPSGFIGNPNYITANGIQIYTVTASNNGCLKTNTIQVTGTECCIPPPRRNPFIFTNVTLVPFGNTSALAWSTLVVGNYYNNVTIAVPPSNVITGYFGISGFLNINAANVTFSNTNFYIADAAVVNQNLTTTINKSYWHGCTANWRGIVSNAALTISNSVIEDAQTAVSITGGGSHPGLFATNTIFNINAANISVFNKNLNNFNVSSCIFTSRVFPFLYNYTSGVLWNSQAAFTPAALASYSFGYLKGSTIMGISPVERGHFGITLFLAKQPTAANSIVTVGNTSILNNSANTNYFDNLQVGVYQVASNVATINNYFQNIFYIPVADITSNINSCIFSNASLTRIGANTFGPFAAQSTNTFVSSQYGVTATNNGTLAISNNLFNNISVNGIYVNKWYAGATNNNANTITNNTFNQVRTDVYCFDNQKIDLNISNNNSTYVVGGPRPGLSYNVYIAELSKNPLAQYNVNFNTFTGKLNAGVFATNADGAIVNSNNITVTKASGATFNAPIWLDNTDHSFINKNVLDCSPSNSHSFNSFGIFSNISANNRYSCNTVTGVGSCFKFQGTCPVDGVYGNSLNNNPADPCIFGIFLDNFATTGPINYPISAGSTTQAGDNTFGDFDYSGTFGFAGSDSYAQNNSNNINTPIEYSGLANSGNLFFPLVNNAIFPSNAYTTAQKPSPFFLCSNLVNFLTWRVSNGIPPFFGNGLNFGSNTANTLFMGRKSAYELFKKTAINTGTIAGATAFVTAQAATNIGAFYGIDVAVHNYALTKNTGTLNAAIISNSALTVTNSIEGYQKSFNSIYHLYLQGDSLITPTQITNLKNIAMLCPFIDGTAVYQARALLSRFDTTIYINTCEIPNIAGTGNRLIGNTSAVNKTVDALETKVYPNPANNELTITTELDGATISIYNIVGELIMQMPLTTTTILKVDELKVGTYLYKITKDKTFIKADRLIINH